MQLSRGFALSAVMALALGCGDSAPSNPTWTEDVRPILIANCVKCHSQPARFGAPSTFRLDVFNSTATDDGENVTGAFAMARFIHERTANETMPPTIPLTDRQIEILRNWSEARAQETDDPARGEPVAGNRAPTMTLDRRLDASEVGELLVILYTIDDLDFDLVTGSLSVTPAGSNNAIAITNELRSGTGEVTWDIGTFAEGSYTVSARLDDGNDTFDVDLGSYEVVHANGNTAPTANFLFPGRSSQIVRPADSPQIEFEISDADTLDALTYDLDALLGDETISLVADGALASNAGPQALALDLSGLRASPNWRLRLTFTDGTSTRTATTLPFVVSDSDTTLTYADAAVVFDRHCIKCHPGDTFGAPGIGFFLDTYSSASFFLPRVYRRAVLERNMPPHSANLIFPDDPPMTDAERDILADWILGGAPEN